MQDDVFPGILIILCAVLAILMCNIGYVAEYDAFWAMPLKVSLGGIGFQKQLLPLINEGLMALFFLAVTLEIKYECLYGHLNNKRYVAFPAMAALGGMIVPACIFLYFNFGGEYQVGWAIPTATDIAFSLACLMLLGSRFPSSLRIFLLSLAIFDDLAAIIIIAVYYTENISTFMLVGAGVMVCVLGLCNRILIKPISIYLLLGGGLWLFMLKSGVHATLAGSALALMIPMRQDGGVAALHLYKRLLPIVQYVILPLFAFANTGVLINGAWDVLYQSDLAWGIVLGLLLGKPLGIMLFSWLAVTLSIASMPKEMTYYHVMGVSLLCAIGFTMSLFVGMLAFDEHMGDILDVVRLSVLGASLLAGVTGSIFLRAYCRRRSE